MTRKWARMSLLASGGAPRTFQIFENEVMRFCITLILLAVFAIPTVADDEIAKSTDVDPIKPQSETDRLRRRITELEKRVAQLEERLKHLRITPPPGSTYTPTPQPYAPTPQTRPAVPWKPAPHPPQQAPQVVPPVPQQTPQPNRPIIPRPQQKVPEGWQRFRFNGQDFYIIPVDRVGFSQGLRAKRIK